MNALSSLYINGQLPVVAIMSQTSSLMLPAKVGEVKGAELWIDGCLSLKLNNQACTLQEALSFAETKLLSKQTSIHHLHDFDHASLIELSVLSTPLFYWKRKDGACLCDGSSTLSAEEAKGIAWTVEFSP